MKSVLLAILGFIAFAGFLFYVITTGIKDRQQRKNVTCAVIVRAYYIHPRPKVFSSSPERFRFKMKECGSDFTFNYYVWKESFIEHNRGDTLYWDK